MSSTKGSSQEEHQTLSFFLLLPPSLHMHGHMISKITCPHWHVSRHMISSTSILISSYVFQGGTRAILYSLFIKINLESYIYIYTRSHKLLINFVFFRFLTMFFIFFFFFLGGIHAICGSISIISLSFHLFITWAAVFIFEWHACLYFECQLSMHMVLAAWWYHVLLLFFYDRRTYDIASKIILEQSLGLNLLAVCLSIL